jgi:hypothetical protein
MMEGAAPVRSDAGQRVLPHLLRPGRADAGASRRIDSDAPPTRVTLRCSHLVPPDLWRPASAAALHHFPRCYTQRRRLLTSYPVAAFVLDGFRPLHALSHGLL